VNRWLKKMGYSFVLRKFTYPSRVRVGGPLEFTSWWDNKGVAPCYRAFPLALRLRNSSHSEIILTEADIRTWLPGDSLFDSSVTLPASIPAGVYSLDLGILDSATKSPKIKLAIEGRREDGWDPLGSIQVEQPQDG
jgi:hypothetical protein